MELNLAAQQGQRLLGVRQIEDILELTNQLGILMEITTPLQKWITFYSNGNIIQETQYPLKTCKT